MRLIAALSAVLVLAGCGITPQGDMLRGTLVAKGTEVANQSVDSAEFVLCEAAPIGIIRHRYLTDPFRAQAYTTFCESGSTGFLSAP